ncbi:VWA domain-containing protein [Reinekea sp.]|uniref:VWA domain-containing protein n=1 Tax=Reinekea sp. TaxID=1970455 RepID=UPI002579A7F6|nr:VWA domain-containing protein [Reinekea sp.]
MIWLRPYLLLLLVLWLPLAYRLIRNGQHQSAWQRLIDPALYAALAGQVSARRQMRSWLVPILGVLIILALAGPAQPTNSAQSVTQGNLYVVLDNSLSMAGTDLLPNRLTRAKRMIADWAGSGLFDKTSVIVYSASAHLLTPLTRDVATLSTQLAALTPFLMPEFGNNAEQAFALLAGQLVSGDGPAAHVLWLTDDIAAAKVNAIRQALPKAQSWTVVAVGTAAGSPIPLPNEQGYLSDNDQLVVVSTQIGDLLQRAAGLGFSAAEMGSQPSLRLLGEQSVNVAEQMAVQDLGYWLLLPIALLLLWVNRQASLSSAGVLMLVLLSGAPNEALAVDLLHNRNQQAYQALVRQDPELALQLAKDPALRAEAQYQSGQFELAAKTFLSLATPEALFNAGNALAHDGKLEEAVQAYQQSLDRAPNPAAEKNKALIEAFLQQQQEQQDSQSGEQNPDAPSEPNEQPDGGEPSQPGDQAEPQPGNTDQDGNPTEAPESSETSQAAQEQAAQEAADQAAEQAAAGEEKSAEQLRADQEVQAVLNQLQAPAGSLLQQKFRYQFQQNPIEPDGTLW